MKTSTAIILGAAGGVALGFILAGHLANSSACCNVVATGVRDKVADNLGGGAVAFGDALGIWSPLAGIVSNLGLA